jgi:hypothetical protein
MEVNLISLTVGLLRELQSSTGEELRPFREAGRTLLPSVLDRAFKGEL